MKVLLVYVPGGAQKIIPLGLLYVANILIDIKCEVEIFNACLDKNIDNLLNLITKYNPDVIGYGGIATSYPQTKRTSEAIKHSYENLIQIAGGPLASTYELLLENRVVNYVVHGEAEISLPKLISFFNGKGSIENVGGVSYLSGDCIKQNAPEKQIEDLDIVKLPAYHLVNADEHILSLKDFIESNKYELLLLDKKTHASINSFISKGKDKYLPIISSRGCTHSCLFCYRHVRGIRRHSVNYVIGHIKYLMDKYNLGGVHFVEELFNSDRQWVFDLCDAIEDSSIEMFYRIGSARVDKVDKEMLCRLKDTGCIEIGYGHESGSEKILKEYRKGVSVSQNTKATLLTRKAGIVVPIQLVIGSPGETSHTIFETSKFLKNVRALTVSANYIIPLPGTPIWNYVMKKKLIDDIESYLDRVASVGGTYKIGLNLTSSSDFVWKLWRLVLYRTTQINKYKSRKNYFLCLLHYLFIAPVFKSFLKVVGEIREKFFGK